MAHKNPGDLMRVKPHAKVRLRDWDSAWESKEMNRLRTDQLKTEAREILRHNLERLADAQDCSGPAINTLCWWSYKAWTPPARTA